MKYIVTLVLLFLCACGSYDPNMGACIDSVVLSEGSGTFYRVEFSCIESLQEQCKEGDFILDKPITVNDTLIPAGTTATRNFILGISCK